MLDYLLVQPDTQKLWQYNQPDTLRYIVVDEFHTFDGAQGTDLACLWRRLKYRLKTPANHLACVGTSATLGSNASQEDMLTYASTIFQEPFLEWLREWDQFLHSDRLDLASDKSLPNLIDQRLTWEIVNQFGHRSAVGPSLERSGACSCYFNLEQMEQAIATLHLKLTNEIDALCQVSPARIQQFFLGLLHHLRSRGGILQPATRFYINQGNTFVLQRPL